MALYITDLLFCLSWLSSFLFGLPLTLALVMVLDRHKPKWKHFPRYWPFLRGIHRSTVNSPHKGQWRGALMFSLICAWINDWVNNREAGDLRRSCAHYDVTVMIAIVFMTIVVTSLYVIVFVIIGAIATILIKLLDIIIYLLSVNTLRPRQYGRHFADDTFKRIFVNENVKISIKNSLNFVPKGPFNNNSALVQIMAWRRPGDKPLSEPMMFRSPTHICVTGPQWVKKEYYVYGIWQYKVLSMKSYFSVKSVEKKK